MMWKAIPILSIGLASGCVATTTGNYCDIAGPMYFDDNDTVAWLSENDDKLLAEIVINNETWAELCTGRTSL